MRMEVECPNPDGTLLAGMHGQVRFEIRPAHPPLLVPSSALAFGPEGTRVTVVKGDRVRFVRVMLGRDLGTELEILDGLSGDERVVSVPGERLSDGLEVRVAEAPATGPANRQ